MNRDRFASDLARALAAVALIALGQAIVSSRAMAYQEPEPVLPERPIPPGQLKPPDLPPPADGGPSAFVYTTDESIRLFEGRIARNPRDYISCRILGEFHDEEGRGDW